jgi:methionine synthase II (cobalamin-independent)
MDVLNRAVAGQPADLTIGMHLCRGNLESLQVGDSGYAPIAGALFTCADVDAFLLEYDSRRAGDFAPLRYLPADKRAYRGIISTKNPALESPDDLVRHWTQRIPRTAITAAMSSIDAEHAQNNPAAASWCRDNVTL